MRFDRTDFFIQGSLGGLLAGLSVLNGISFLMPIALALLWSASRNIFAGFIWGFCAVLISHSWLLALHPLEWLGIPYFLSLASSIAILLTCSAYGGLLVGLWSLMKRIPFFSPLRNGSFREELFCVIVLASLWGFAEVFLAKTPIFWIGLGASLLPQDRMLTGLARWIGAGGLAALQLIIGWWIFNIYMNFKQGNSLNKIIFSGISFLLFLHICGGILLLPSNYNSSIPVALWQTNIPLSQKFSIEQRAKLPASIENALRSAKKLSAYLLAAPEGTILTNQEVDLSGHIPFLTGGFRFVSGIQRSSLLVFEEGEKNFSAVIDKHRLVPIGEWIPSWLNNYFNGLSLVGGIASGDRSRLLEWSGEPISISICYELANGNLVAQSVQDGAKWILAIANLDPYPIALQDQFIRLAQLRTIETSRDLISVANTGPSGRILDSGEVFKLFPPNEEKVDIVNVNLNERITGYVRWREMPLLFSLLSGLVAIFIIKIL